MIEKKCFEDMNHKEFEGALSSMGDALNVWMTFGIVDDPQWRADRDVETIDQYFSRKCPDARVVVDAVLLDLMNQVVTTFNDLPPEEKTMKSLSYAHQCSFQLLNGHRQLRYRENERSYARMET